MLGAIQSDSTGPGRGVGGGGGGGEIPHRPQGKERGRWRGEKGSGLEGFRGREKGGRE